MIEISKSIKIMKNLFKKLVLKLYYKNGLENRVDLYTSFHHPMHVNAFTTAVHYYINPVYDAGFRGFQFYPLVFK